MNNKIIILTLISTIGTFLGGMFIVAPMMNIHNSVAVGMVLMVADFILSRPFIHSIANDGVLNTLKFFKNIRRF